MNLLVTTSLLGLGFGLPQSQGPPQPAPVEVSLDGVAAIVGNEIFTKLELDEIVRREANNRGLLRPEDIVELQGRFLTDRYMLLLKAQAGEDMGFDPELVKRGEERLFNERLEELGGPISASKDFVANGVRPDQYQEILRQRLYGYSWESAQVGKSAGATGRPSVDRYIRPGVLFAAYHAAAESQDPAERARIGATPLRIVLQQIVLPLDANGGDESTLELARTLLEEVHAGADFTQLVQLWSVLKGEGILKPETLDDIGQRSRVLHKSDVLREFAATAATGELSPPIMGWNQEQSPAYWVYMVRERTETTSIGEFLDPTVQKELEEDLLQALDRLRLRVALQTITDSVYVWPPSLRGAEGE